MQGTTRETKRIMIKISEITKNKIKSQSHRITFKHSKDTNGKKNIKINK